MPDCVIPISSLSLFCFVFGRLLTQFRCHFSIAFLCADTDSQRFRIVLFVGGRVEVRLNMARQCAHLGQAQGSYWTPGREFESGVSLDHVCLGALTLSLLSPYRPGSGLALTLQLHVTARSGHVCLECTSQWDCVCLLWCGCNGLRTERVIMAGSCG